MNTENKRIPKLGEIFYALTVLDEHMKLWLKGEINVRTLRSIVKSLFEDSVDYEFTITQNKENKKEASISIFAPVPCNLPYISLEWFIKRGRE